MSDARLPGSVHEVRASPIGPSTGAYFDFDGTLIAGYSALHLSKQRFRTRDVGVGEIARSIAVALSAGRGEAGFADVLQIGADAWKGRQDADLAAMGQRLFDEALSPLMYPEAVELVSVHLDRGHTVVLSSSATEYQVEPAARSLGIDQVLCNRYVKADARLTGELEEPVIWGATKAEIVQRHAAQHGVDLGRSYFYADGDEDVALMHLVGHPRPANPRRRLAAVAKARGWPVLRFERKGADS
jgi:putative phosphoserine phosphatase / 1-acylglycerol-3-phosphate O-acyltransferase